MPRFNVVYSFQITRDFDQDVEAENSEEAAKIVRNMITEGSIESDEYIEDEFYDVTPQTPEGLNEEVE